jgi:hypothetical protein
MMRYLLLLWVVILRYTALAQDSVKVYFQPTFKGVPLMLDQTYLLGQDTFLIQELKFYITNLSWQEQHAALYNEPKHYLIDLSNPLSQYISLPRVENEISSIAFLLGIDSATQAVGVMGGDLDPTTGMYWTWQSGYIHFKLEGTASVCPARHHRFQYHIGGYNGHQNTIRSLQLIAIPKDTIVITLAIDTLLQQTDAKVLYEVMSPGEKAVKMANQIASVINIKP